MEQRRRRLAYTLRFLVPPREPIDEREVERAQALLDDADVLYNANPGVLGPHLGALRYLYEGIRWCRDEPPYLRRVEPDAGVFLRQGPVRLRAHQGVWLTIPGSLSTGHPEPDVFWASDERAQIFVEVAIPGPEFATLAGGEFDPRVALEGIAAWGPDVIREPARFMGMAGRSVGRGGSERRPRAHASRRHVAGRSICALHGASRGRRPTIRAGGGRSGGRGVGAQRWRGARLILDIRR